MNCKRIREIIITDYLDKEASAGIEKEIKAHLSACSGCRAYELGLREKVSQPLRNIGQVQPPGQVWQRIKQAIEDEEAEYEYAPSFWERLLDYWRNNFWLKRPVYALSTISLMVLVTFLLLHAPLRRQMLVKDYLLQKAEYLQSLQNPTNGEVKADYNFGTSAERYFF